MSEGIAPAVRGILARLRSAPSIAELWTMVAKRPDRAMGGLEQVATSIFSMVGFILLSRFLEIEAFGIIAAAISLALVVQLVHDSITVAPLVIDCPNPTEDRAGLGQWLIWHLLVAVAFAVLPLLVGLAVGGYESAFGRVLVLSSPIVLGATLFSFSRRMHYHWTTFRSLLVQTALYGAFYATGLLLLWANGALTPETAAIAVALAFGIPGVLFSLRNWREARFGWNLLPHVKASTRLIASMGGVGLVSQAGNAAALIMLSWLSTPVAVAVFTVTRTLERPIALAVSTVLEVDTSRASRALPARGIAGLSQVVAGAQWTLLVMTALPVALVLLFPEFFLSLIYGETYAGATLELQLRILMLVPVILTAPPYLGLVVMRDTGFLLRISIFGFAVGFAFLLGCHALGQLSAATANAGLLVMQLVTVPFFYLRYAAKLREAGGGAR